MSDVSSHSSSDCPHLRSFEPVLEREDRPVAPGGLADRAKLPEMLREACLPGDEVRRGFVGLVFGRAARHCSCIHASRSARRIVHCLHTLNARSSPA